MKITVLQREESVELAKGPRTTESGLKHPTHVQLVAKGLARFDGPWCSITEAGRAELANIPKRRHRWNDHECVVCKLQRKETRYNLRRVIVAVEYRRLGEAWYTYPGVPPCEVQSTVNASSKLDVECGEAPK